jgi:predicted GIY-YIG superfamily endonuclease
MTSVYKIVCPDGCYYIGSTVQQVKNRIYEHIRKSVIDRKVYNHIRSIGWDNVNIIILESCDEDKRREREQSYINLKDEKCLNKINVIKADDYSETYYQNHREQMNTYAMSYYEEYKEELKTKMRERNKQNRDKLREYQRQWRLKKKSISDSSSS